MCGICGKLTFDREATVSPSLINSMLATIRHRGPDDQGIRCSENVGLGHRLLSIIGVSSGHQPLCNEDGTVWVTFNGEIYNYKELRADLIAKGHSFRTQTDTEVIVHLYEECGHECVTKLRGMFAFAIWDERDKILLLARDRIGIKPLYYFVNERCIVFASEIKAILVDEEVEPEIAPEMIDRFLTFLYVPGEETLLKGIRKLAPGTVMIVRDGRVDLRTYWDLEFGCVRGSLRNAERELVGLLEETVRLHMMSDVPVGFLLSGGLDSTALLSLASRVAPQTEFPVRSYTVGFGTGGIEDERPYAELAADAFGSRHHDLTISAADFAAFMPNYIWHMEEPVCEPPAIALYYISRLAREEVKVLISGEGGDEAFAGYPNYRTILWIERIKRMLGPLAGASATCIDVANRMSLRSERVARYAPLLAAPFDSYYYGRTSNPNSYFNSSETNLYSGDFAERVGKDASIAGLRAHLSAAPQGDVVNRMLYLDTKMWLPDDLLLKADKMTMANSVELRVPLLDHRILEFAASLPGNFKIRGLATKYIAKRALRGQVPPEIMGRRKAGFPVPYEAWLGNELRGWLSDILLDRTTLSRGYFKESTIRGLLQGATSWPSFRAKELFSLVTLELWHRSFATPGAVRQYSAISTA